MQKTSKETAYNGFILPNLCADNVLLLLLMTVQLIVIAFVVFEHGLQINWAEFGQVTLYVQWQVILSVLLLCRLRHYFARISKPYAATLAYLLLLAVAFIVSFSVSYLMQKPWQFMWRNLLLSGILAGLGLRYLYVQQQVIEREKAMLQANLVALQAKIRPHFLFNTMNSIASLIRLAPEKAENMVVDLSAILRSSLREVKAEVPLSEEWALCESYLAIEQQRLGERFTWRCDFSALTEDVLVPAFSLQPLVENAIYHGIQANAAPGFIEINAIMRDDKITFYVINSQIQNRSASKHSGNNMAIDNIRLRITELYGPSAKLELYDEKDRYVAQLTYKIKK